MAFFPDRNDTSKATKTSQQVHRFTKKDLKPNRSRVLPDRNNRKAVPVNLQSMDRSDAETETYGPGMRSPQSRFDGTETNPFRNINVRR